MPASRIAMLFAERSQPARLHDPLSNTQSRALNDHCLHPAGGHAKRRYLYWLWKKTPEIFTDTSAGHGLATAATHFARYG